ncbi:sphingosine kinase 1-like [Trichomycterus rosablanca]|uniref:sphingosine kinase 1-like n=1 Tax=Trichomycterus rosablanca TaxID=2290929 RepID=UPI002F35BC32
MRGEFTAARDSRVRYALELTERELTVQRLAGRRNSGARAVTVIGLADCIGCRVHGAEDAPDAGACFSVYLYPVRSRWTCSAAPSRRRVERRFRVTQSTDPRGNLEVAHRWAQAIREGSYRNGRTGVVVGEIRRLRRLLVLLNPHSGKGQALSLFNNHVQHMLQEAGITYTLVVTEFQNHAREIVQKADLSQLDALVIMSGDGLLFEVVNGLMEREDWEKAIRTPLGVLPGGSGNAVAASIHYYTGAQPVSGEDLLMSCGFMLCKGLVSRLDLTSVCIASNQRLFSFLSLAWGFVADVDIESEKYRHIGGARFTMGTLVRLASLRVYQGKLAYLPVEESQNQEPSRTSLSDNYTLFNSSDHPVPAHWTVVREEDFVLVLALYQSHLAEDLIGAPDSRLDDGNIHLIYVKAGISRTSLLRLFLAMKKGTHLNTNCPFVVYVKVRALRLEPYSPQGTITVDGELVEYGPVQAQIYHSLARIIAG